MGVEGSGPTTPRQPGFAVKVPQSMRPHRGNKGEREGTDDDEAKRKAEQIVDGHSVELWQEARKVETFPRKK